MNELLILRGIPASGKSTFAKKFIEKNKYWLIISRDSIRDMFGHYWLPERENLVKECEFSMIKLCLNNKWNVVVDDTNLNSKTFQELQDLANECNARVIVKDFEISLEEALERNRNREKVLPDEVIKGFYERYKNV